MMNAAPMMTDIEIRGEGPEKREHRLVVISPCMNMTHAVMLSVHNSTSAMKERDRWTQVDTFEGQAGRCLREGSVYTATTSTLNVKC